VRPYDAAQLRRWRWSGSFNQMPCVSLQKIRQTGGRYHLRPDASLTKLLQESVVNEQLAHAVDGNEPSFRFPHLPFGEHERICSQGPGCLLVETNLQR